MRWRFYNPHDPAESAEHERLSVAIDTWWDAFVEVADTIDAMFTRGAEFDIVGFMNEALGAVDPRLMWEYGPGLIKGGHRLVITPESDRGLRPFVDEIVSRAPDLPRWEFYRYRLAESVADAEAAVRGRCQAELAGTFVTAAIGDHHKIDLTYHHPDTVGPDDERAGNIAFVATESLLSEELLDHWIGYIDVATAPKPGLLGRLRGEPGDRRLLPLDRLKPTVEALIESMRDQLPPEALCAYDDPSGVLPLATEAGKGTVLRLEPPERDAYPGRSDMAIASTGLDRVWMAALQDSAFDSRRFSRHGETFCYLKLSGIDTSDVSARADVEDALNDALKPRGLGCTWGGGMGYEYAYVDLALADVDAAIPVIRDVLRGANIEKQSWLLFFDADLCDEWLGVYDDSPAPPETPVPPDSRAQGNDD